MWDVIITGITCHRQPLFGCVTSKSQGLHDTDSFFLDLWRQNHRDHMTQTASFWICDVKITGITWHRQLLFGCVTSKSQGSHDTDSFFLNLWRQNHRDHMTQTASFWICDVKITGITWHRQPLFGFVTSYWYHLTQTASGIRPCTSVLNCSHSDGFLSALSRKQINAYLMLDLYLAKMCTNVSLWFRKQCCVVKAQFKK